MSDDEITKQQKHNFQLPYILLHFFFFQLPACSDVHTQQSYKVPRGAQFRYISRTLKSQRTFWKFQTPPTSPVIQLTTMTGNNLPGHRQNPFRFVTKYLCEYFREGLMKTCSKETIYSINSFFRNGFLEHLSI